MGAPADLYRGLLDCALLCLPLHPGTRGLSRNPFSVDAPLGAKLSFPALPDPAVRGSA